MVTIIAASIYSMSNGSEIAYEATYSEGTRVRSVLSDSGHIRKEYFKNSEWIPAGAPYKVKSNKNRSAEKLIDIVEEFTRHK